jgi:hypothetical protein
MKKRKVYKVCLRLNNMIGSNHPVEVLVWKRLISNKLRAAHQGAVNHAAQPERSS